MSRVVCVHHINLEVQDLERAKKWWTDVFGLEQLDKGPGIGPVDNQLFLGMQEVHFTERGEKAVALPYGHPALEIKDMDEFLGHLDSLKIPYYADPGKSKLGEGERADASRAIFFLDSEGNTVEVVNHRLGLRWARDDVGTAPMTTP